MSPDSGLEEVPPKRGNPLRFGLSALEKANRWGRLTSVPLVRARLSSPSLGEEGAAATMEGPTAAKRENARIGLRIVR